MRTITRILPMFALALAISLLALEGGVAPLAPATLERPALAREAVEESSVLALDHAVALTTDLLRAQGYRQFNTAIYALPAGTDWTPIAGFYAEHLPAAGWRPTDEASVERIRRSIWARGLLRREALAVVLVSRAGSASGDYLLLLAAR